MAQLEAHQVTPTTTAAVAPPLPAEKVTIEDLGADADEDDVPSTATEAVSLPNSDADFEENSSELGELRKRRLKFLEERNKFTNERTTAE